MKKRLCVPFGALVISLAACHGPGPGEPGQVDSADTQGDKNDVSSEAGSAREESFQFNDFGVTYSFDESHAPQLKRIINLETGEDATLEDIRKSLEEVDHSVQHPTSTSPGAGEVGQISQPLKLGWQFGSFYAHYRGGGADTDTHPLKPCVSAPVTHVHLTIKKSQSTPDSEAYAKLHFGRYESGGKSCYVVFDNLHPWVCLKTCWSGTPGKKETEEVKQQASQGISQSLSASNLSTTLSWELVLLLGTVGAFGLVANAT